MSNNFFHDNQGQRLFANSLQWWEHGKTEILFDNLLSNYHGNRESEGQVNTSIEVIGLDKHPLATQGNTLNTLTEYLNHLIYKWKNSFTKGKPVDGYADAENIMKEF